MAALTLDAKVDRKCENNYVRVRLYEYSNVWIVMEMSMQWQRFQIQSNRSTEIIMPRNYTEIQIKAINDAHSACILCVLLCVCMGKHQHGWETILSTYESIYTSTHTEKKKTYSGTKWHKQQSLVHRWKQTRAGHPSTEQMIEQQKPH